MTTNDTQPIGTKFSPGWSAWSSHFTKAQMAPLAKHIAPHYEGRPIRWVEIGSHEGRSACWLVNNILTHEDSCIVCIDPWEPWEDGESKHESRWDRFACNKLAMCEAGDRIKPMRASSQHLAPRDIMDKAGGWVDVVYVDADHRAKSALRDTILGWGCLRKGGFMVWDDLHLNRGDQCPKPGIDAFLSLWKGEWREIYRGYGLIVRKL
jgi:hypothetical protein